MRITTFASFLLIAAASCAPKDVIPAASTHPASPAAPSGQASPAPAEAPEAEADEHEGHAEHEHQHEAPGTATTPPAPSPADPAAIAAAEQAAYEKAKPVFQKYCAECHSKSGKRAKKGTLDHFSIDTYPFGGHHAEAAGETVREVLGASGEKATMPKNDPGVVQGDELAAIVEWSKAFDASHAAGLHDHHGGGHEHHHGGH